MAAQSLILLPVHLAVPALAISSLKLGGSHALHSSLPQTVLANNCRRMQRFPHLRTNATEGGVLGVEPDLSEDYVEDSEYMTLGQDREDEFPYGKADGSHTWHVGDDNVDFMDAISNQIKEGGGPNDHPGQATISWLFLPVIFSGMAFGVKAEYLLLVAVLFIFAFIGIEMAKPDKPSNFEL